MANYYEYLGISPKASVKKILDAYREKELELRTSGKFAEMETYLYELQETLLDPDRRKAYNLTLIKSPGTRKAASGPGSPRDGKEKGKAPPARRKKISPLRRRVMPYVLVLLLLFLCGYLAWLLWPQYRPMPRGRYLLDPSTGAAVAVLLNKEPRHLFENGMTADAFQVYILKTGKKTWFSSAGVRQAYKLGREAPAELLKKARLPDASLPPGKAPGGN
ncbi:MAG: hypothetical protein P8Z49_05425 [Acidobacteriota bacterium]|jgi:hypothetical protein